MKLHELTPSSIKMAESVLKEGFETQIKVSSLTRSQTSNMLRKISGMIKEAKSNTAYYQNSHQSPAYLKLVVMEQALWAHYSTLGSQKEAKIVVESEEIGQAQVVLAAKDMVDSVQKMIETASDILVKDLPAVVDSIRSQIGANEGSSFNDQASTALRGLIDALMQGKTAMQQSMDTLTGNGDTAAFDASADMGDDLGDIDVGDETQPEEQDELDISGDFGSDMEEPADTGTVGRERR